MNPPATDDLKKLVAERVNNELQGWHVPPRLRTGAIAAKCGVTEEVVIERIRELKGKA